MFCSLKKGITPAIYMLCFVIITSVLLNLFGSCFRTLAVTLISDFFSHRKLILMFRLHFADWQPGIILFWNASSHAYFQSVFPHRKLILMFRLAWFFWWLATGNFLLLTTTVTHVMQQDQTPGNPYAAASDGQGHWILTCTHVYAENSCMRKYTRQCKNLQVLVKEQNNSITVTWFLNPFTLPMADWNTD